MVSDVCFCWIDLIDMIPKVFICSVIALGCSTGMFAAFDTLMYTMWKKIFSEENVLKACIHFNLGFLYLIC